MLLALDFADASKQLRVAQKERRLLACRATLDGVHGVSAYFSSLFGHIAGPLVWGRMAALAMRATAVLQPSSLLSAQCCG